MTLAQIDDEKLPETVADKEAPKDERPEYVNKEMPGLNLREGTWTIARQTDDEVEFQCELPRWGLTVVKTYRLDKVPEEAHGDVDAKAYHLVFDVEIRNTGGQTRRVAYQLDGPTGLPIEGWWYASKVGRAGRPVCATWSCCSTEARPAKSAVRPSPRTIWRPPGRTSR